MKTDKLLSKSVQLIVNNSSIDGESVASISENPFITWIKFVLTDDKPNANGDRIPKEEFDNIIRTGRFMPVKLSEKVAEALELGHLGSKPVGTITHLKNNGDHIEAIAALWSRERPEDIEVIKERFKNGQPVNVSWEVLYDIEKSKKSEAGYTDLKDVTMNAATIVDLPSYMGRTPVLAFASISKEAQAKFDTILEKVTDGKELSEQEQEILAEINNILIKGEENTMDTISREDHDKIVGDLQEKLDTVNSKLEESTSTIEELQPLKTELEELKPKYAELEEFKNEVEEEREKKQKLASIKEKFEEASIEVTDEYLEEKEETLLGMSEAALDFFVQELVAFNKKAAEEGGEEDGKREASASISLGSGLPSLKPSEDGDIGTGDIVEFLRETLDN